jgi:hypothetical protein
MAKKPKIPSTNIGGDVHIIGDGNVPKAVQDLIIAMFREYVLPEFVKFNTVLEAMALRVEKLEGDRRFVLSVEDRLYELLYAKIFGAMPPKEGKEKKKHESGAKNKSTQAKKE